jgi:hypothetical protein
MVGEVMRDMHTGFLRLAVAACALAAAPVRAQPVSEDRWGWSYCAPPYPPACVDAPAADAAKTRADAAKTRADAAKTGADAAKTATCARDVKMFIDLVIAYRLCQTRELERAILEANRVVDAFKCRTDKKACTPRKGD